MIIFYNKKSGEIIGTIDGRVHDEGQLKVSITQPNIEVDKIVCQWKISRQYIKNGKKYTEFEPDNVQKDTFIEIDKNSSSVYQYKIDLETKKLIKI